MSQISPVVFLLLMAFALWLAWLAGYRSRFRKLPGLKRNPEQDYFVGLNYLLNDEPDDAIDIFIDALELNSNTLATHLALCTLLRRRGKVDRAIEHGEYLLAVLLAGFVFTLNNTMAVPMWLGVNLAPQPLGLWILLAFASGGLIGLLLGLGLWQRFRQRIEVRQLRAKVRQLEHELGVLKHPEVPATEALPGK